ncbi:MFS transporter [Gloeobacter kilaueensis]|uniref:Major facilitator superfamily MFS_1 n=1 Tax=Gloeobacter kilaueensis (strain ATCC BAA-2537 / CCAP 1431/1 / ULC 316 / JS1) TaxID=1183438 RepID=U5QL40_GLOK1|nr:MFS transporter [Gloeobacter kilaueensis]AGY59603.1 major facilitator superfamily MFS_1 [Gloeobacter kilaueensis JS1]
MGENNEELKALHDPYAALRSRDYRLYACGSMAAVLGQQVQAVAVGWELYERTHSTLLLGWVGLVQALPPILLSLPAGQVADRYDRQRVIMVAQTVVALAALGLSLLSALHGAVMLIYGCLLISALARAFSGPANSALLPQLVPPAALANAVTWRSSWFQVGSVIGPALGGLVIAWQKSAAFAYVLTVACAFSFLLFTAALRPQYRPPARAKEAISFRSLVGGLSFIWSNQIILATITLDLFAVLLGGATTLLPVYAKDILHVGPVGLGWLRAAPSVGALAMAIVLAYLPPMRRAGLTLLLAVSGFGVATIVFGLSHNFYLSLAMLALTGVFDNISVVVRSTLLQLLTPDAMRGRVLAVNFVFVSASNEIGGFESGLVAEWFGPILSVVGGGIGTLVVVLAVAWLWPQVRRLGSLSELAG